MARQSNSVVVIDGEASESDDDVSVSVLINRQEN